MRTSVLRWLAPVVIVLLTAGPMGAEPPKAPSEKPLLLPPRPSDEPLLVEPAPKVPWLAPAKPAPEELSTPPREKDPLLDDEPPPQEDKARLAWLLQKRRDTLRIAMECLEWSWRGGRERYWSDYDQLPLVSRDLLGAELEVCRTREERIECHQRHVKRMKEMEAEVVRSMQGQSLQDLWKQAHAQITTHRLHAENALARERIGAPKGAATAAELAKLRPQLLQRRDNAREAAKACDDLVNAGKTTFDAWRKASEELLQAELELAQTPAERIALREQHVQRVEPRVKAMAREVEAKRRMGVPSRGLPDSTELDAHLLRVEIDLTRERIAARKGPPSEGEYTRLGWLLSQRRDTLLKRVESVEVIVREPVRMATPDLLSEAKSELAAAEIELRDMAADLPPELREPEPDTVAARAELLERALQSAQEAENTVRAVYMARAKGGKTDRYALAKAKRLECEIAIVRERLRPKRAPGKKENGPAPAPIQDGPVPRLKPAPAEMEEIELAPAEPGPEAPSPAPLKLAPPRSLPPGREKDPLLEDGPAPQEDKAKLAWLLQKRRDTLRLVIEGLEALRERGLWGGPGGPTDPFVRASEDLLDAELELCATPEQRIAAREEHLKRVKPVEDGLFALYKTGSSGGAADAYYRAKAFRLQAETGLARERLAAALAPPPESEVERIKSLLVERREALRTRTEVLDAMIRARRESPASDLVFRAYADLAAAELEVRTTAAERIAVREQLVKHAKDHEDAIAGLNKTGARGGIADAYEQAKACRLEAEIGLLRERKESGAKLASLLRERRDALLTRVQILEGMVRFGKLTASSDLVCDAHMDLGAAELALADATGQPAAERERLLEDSLRRATEYEKGIRAVYLTGSREGPRHFLPLAKAKRLECEIALVRERLRTKRAAVAGSRDGAAESKLDPQEAVAEIRKLGGEIIVDDKRPDKPVVGVDLEGRQVDDAALEPLSALRQLEFLHLGGTKVTDAGLVHLKGLTQLRGLGLGGTQVTDAGLAHLKGLTRLQSLGLESTQVTDAGLAHVKGLAQLQWLALAETPITDAGLVHLKGFSRLQRLDLSRTQVVGAGLAHLKGLAQLEELLLTDTKVTDAGLEHLRGLTRLRTLNLWNAKVTDTGLVHLKGLTELKSLSLCGTSVTDAGVVHLKGLTQLESLDLSKTRVTDAGKKDLQKALPKVRDLQGGRPKPVPAGPEGKHAVPEPPKGTTDAQSDCGLLTVQVPAGAKMLIDGYQTRSQGTRR